MGKQYVLYVVECKLTVKLTVTAGTASDYCKRGITLLTAEDIVTCSSSIQFRSGYPVCVCWNLHRQWQASGTQGQGRSPPRTLLV